jgi:hypothetical protein
VAYSLVSYIGIFQIHSLDHRHSPHPHPTTAAVGVGASAPRRVSEGRREVGEGGTRANARMRECGPGGRRTGEKVGTRGGGKGGDREPEGPMKGEKEGMRNRGGDGKNQVVLYRGIWETKIQANGSKKVCINLVVSFSNFHTLWTDFGPHRAPIQIQKQTLKKVLISIFIITFLVIIVMFIVFLTSMALGTQKKQPSGNRAKKCMHGKRKSRYLPLFFLKLLLLSLFVIMIVIILCRCMTCKGLSQEDYLQMHGYVTWNQVCVCVCAIRCVCVITSIHSFISASGDQ